MICPCIYLELRLHDKIPHKKSSTTNMPSQKSLLFALPGKSCCSCSFGSMPCPAIQKLLTKAFTSPVRNELNLQMMWIMRIHSLFFLLCNSFWKHQILFVMPSLRGWLWRNRFVLLFVTRYCPHNPHKDTCDVLLTDVWVVVVVVPAHKVSLDLGIYVVHKDGHVLLALVGHKQFCKYIHILS